MRRFLMIAVCLVALISCDDAKSYAADLVIADVEVSPIDPEPGQTVTITFRIRNQGDRKAGPFSWVLLRSGAGIITERRISELYPNQQTSVQFVTITEVAGTHTYRLLVDIYDEVDEGENGTDNNEHVFIIDVRPAGDG